MEQVNDLFVPTPYDRTLWTRDNRWFVYDFKNGPVEQTWGLEFDDHGNFKGAVKIGDGIDPRLSSDGQKIIAVKHTEISSETVEYPLPRTASLANK
jgi:hypothetical protein